MSAHVGSVSAIFAIAIKGNSEMLTKYILTIGSEKHEISSAQVRNWDQLLCAYSLKDFNGIVRSFSSKFEFVNEAYDLLLDLYLTEGVRASAILTLLTITDRWEWEVQFEAPLDFSTISWDAYVLSIAAIDNSLAALISANKSTKYELLIGNDIKSDKVLKYDRINMQNMVTHQIMGTADYNPMEGEGGVAVAYSLMGKRLPVYVLGNTETYENNPITYADQKEEDGSYFLRFERDSEVRVEVDILVKEFNPILPLTADKEMWLMRFPDGHPVFDTSYEYLCTVLENKESKGYDFRSRCIGVFSSFSELKKKYPNPPQNKYALIGKSEKYIDVESVYLTPITNGIVEWERVSFEAYKDSDNEESYAICLYKHFKYIVDVSGMAGQMLAMLYKSNGPLYIKTTINTSWTSRGTIIEIDALTPQTVAQTLLDKIADGRLNVDVHIDSDDRLDDTLILAAESIRNISGAKFYSSFNDFCDWLQTVFGFTYYIGEKKGRRFVDKQTYYLTIFELISGLTVDNNTYFIPDADTRILFYQPESAFYANNENVLYRNWSGSDKFNNPKTGKARTDVLFYALLDWRWYYMNEDDVYSDYIYTAENVATDCRDTQSVYFVHRDKLFAGENQLTLNHVRDVTYSVDDSIIYSSVQIGYDKQDYETECGRDEWNFTNSYTTGVDVTDKTLSLISKYRADCYGLEFLAQKRAADTTDDQSDQDVFFVFCKKYEYIVGSSITKYGIELNRSTTIRGSLSDDTVFNGEFSPYRCLLANARFISSMCTPLTLRFASSEGNSDIIIDNVPMSSDIVIDNPLFTAGKVSFTTGDVSIPEGNSLICVRANGITYKGFLSYVTLQYARMEAAQYDLIVKEVEL